MKVTIGEHQGKEIKLDIDQLLRTRMLVQANSGGGKSYAIRKLLETTHGKIQQIVLDTEGEFSTLREKFDYVLVGKGGDISADLRTAPLLAERLLELNASAIIDLYELQKHDRIRFVKKFIDAMVDVDKKLWHPCLVVIDEAHLFCPEGKDAKDAEDSAASSVIDLCTRGRKRSFCAVLATQRLSKLNKDAAAECNNKLIGRTGLDIDLKRAAEELGITSKEDARKLRQLEPGSFHAFGPAISREVIDIKIGKVITSHPDIGSRERQTGPAAPQEKIRKMLEKLADLPKEVEEKQRTEESLRTEIRDLKKQLREKPAPVSPAMDEARLKRELESVAVKIRKEYGGQMAAHNILLRKIGRDLESVIRHFKSGFTVLEQMKLPDISLDEKVLTDLIKKEKAEKPALPALVDSPKKLELALGAGRDGAEASILNSLSWWRVLGKHSVKREAVAAVAEMALAGHFVNNLGSLHSKGFVDYPSTGTVSLNVEPSSLGLSGPVAPSEENLRLRISHVLNTAQFKILTCLWDNTLQRRDDVSMAVEIKGGHFVNMLGRLRTLKMIDYPQVGTVELAKWIQEAKELL